ncbi:MAG: M20 family metallopeptidase [Fusobacteriaceae bacterium]|nr:M20 family metallopeptidase [Fusobacteriaceae bacterium]
MKAVQEKAFAFLDAKRDEMLNLWKTLVNMESGTMDKADVDVVAAFLRDKLEAFGATAEVIPFAGAGNGLKAAFGEKTALAPVCFMGHYDTVFPHGTAKARPFAIKDGKATGPGALDMKAGVVIQLYVAKALMEAGYDKRQIKIVLAGDEETGHPQTDMAAVFENEAKGCVAAFNFETGDVANAIVVGRKGSASYDFTITGVAVHAGREPEKGRSAVLEMAHKIIDIQNLNDYPRGLTFNVGRVEGGVTRNAVAGKATMEVDVRVMKEEDYAEVEEKLLAIAKKTYVEGTHTEYTSHVSIGPMERTPGNDRLFALVAKVSEELGFPKPHPIVSGGGSDSTFSVRAGVPTVDQMGVKGEWNHSDREYAVVETLFERAKLAVACVLALESF